MGSYSLPAITSQPTLQKESHHHVAFAERKLTTLKNLLEEKHMAALKKMVTTMLRKVKSQEPQRARADMILRVHSSDNHPHIITLCPALRKGRSTHNEFHMGVGYSEGEAARKRSYEWHPIHVHKIKK